MRRRNIVRESPGVSSSIVICLTIGPSPRKSAIGSPITEQAPEPINCAGGVKRRISALRFAPKSRVRLRQL